MTDIIEKKHYNSQVFNNGHYVITYNLNNSSEYKNSYLCNGIPYITRIHCNNCGKYGHSYNCCMDPVTSIGIICFKIEHITTSNNMTINEVKNIFADLLHYDTTGLVKLKYVKGIPLELMKLSIPKINESSHGSTNIYTNVNTMPLKIQIVDEKDELKNR